jgi:hypothetical protein
MVVVVVAAAAAAAVKVPARMTISATAQDVG